MIYSVHFDHYFRNHVDSCRYAEYKNLTVPIFLQENLIERGMQDGSLNPKFQENTGLLNSVLQSALLAYTQKALFYEDTAAQARRETEIRVFWISWCRHCPASKRRPFFPPETGRFRRRIS